jgi:porphobilinogen synthase
MLEMKKIIREDAGFPRTRLRRNRKSAWSRRLVAENRLSVDDLILPLFVIEGKNKKIPVAMMPGVFRLSIDLVVEKIKEARSLRIPAIALFPSVDTKLRDAKASEAINSQNLICRTVAAIKKSVPDIGIITDVALDPYTSHGQDGLVKNDEILNDAQELIS